MFPATWAWTRARGNLRGLARVVAWGNRRCRACAEVAESSGPGGPVLCGACRARLAPRLAGYCAECGRLFANAGLAPAPCADCLQAPPAWSGFYLYAAYADLLQELFTAFKFNGDLAAGRLLAGLLCLKVGPELGRDLPDKPQRQAWLVPVPLHQTRLQERGFNQSLLLARPLARVLKLRLAPRALWRTRLDPPQSSLSRKERLAHPLGAFAASPLVSGRTIVLLDDVMTTGATLREATRVLLRQGAAEVRLVVLARTPSGSEA